ncbi:reverse transcriptase domain-containing protein [Streptomyces sp. NPDC059863]|uniref:reverse transcriptase domain-containing protein n=1 Tax=unclassified Streptomyces TaxID=2593676 RepID=UPI003650AC1C
MPGRTCSKPDRECHPLPVRERKIPKPGGSGKVTSPGIPATADRVVQAALKLVLEPIFKADFKPVPYGFRPLRRAHDAIAEIHFYGTHGYRWILDADIQACFDTVDHTALMDRVRERVKDKRVLRLVKAFLKADVPTEDNGHEDTITGTPQDGILSPLLANIALSALDDHQTRPWEPNGETATSHLRSRRRATGRPNCRIARSPDTSATANSTSTSTSTTQAQSQPLSPRKRLAHADAHHRQQARPPGNRSSRLKPPTGTRLPT